MVTPSLNAPKPPTIKFLCSYGGWILPRYPDGKLRYHGGHTRVLAVPRSISFSELMGKLSELCGKTVSLRCQLPSEDLDALVTLTSDEDLTNLIEEYDREEASDIQSSSSSSLKIRAFLSTPKNSSPIPTPTPSTASSSSTSTPESPPKSPPQSARFPVTVNRCMYTKPPLKHSKSDGKVPCYGYRNYNRFCLVPNGNYYWQ